MAKPDSIFPLGNQKKTEKFVEMCHCKTCANRLHVIIVTIANGIPYSLASCLKRFSILTYTHSIHFTAFFMHYL